MGPPSYMWSVVDRNVVMRRMTVCCKILLQHVLAHVQGAIIRLTRCQRKIVT